MSTSVNSLTSNFFPEAENGFTTTTAGSVSSGATTVTLNSVSGYTNGAVAVFVIDPTDATKKQTFTGVIDTAGVQVTNVVWTAGTNQTHALGATVVDYATATHISMVTKGLLAAGLNQGGTMTPKVLTSINDANGNEVIKTPATASAVNEITVTNAATGNAPSISATGGDSAINLNLRGKGLAKTVTIGAGATPIFAYDYVVSGCVWSGDAYGSTRNASMTAGVVVINGNPITVALVTARPFTASRDTYIDVLDNGDGTGLLVYTEVTNNNTSPALAANSIRIGIIVTGASNIANVGSVNQGEETKVLPIASSIPYTVTDSLGNLICPRDPGRRIIGLRQITTGVTTTSSSDTQITGLSVPVIVPAGRKIKPSLHINAYNSNANDGYIVKLWEGAVGTTQLAAGGMEKNSLSASTGQDPYRVYTPTSSSITINASFRRTAAGTVDTNSSSTAPTTLLVELV